MATRNRTIKMTVRNEDPLALAGMVAGMGAGGGGGGVGGEAGGC